MTFWFSFENNPADSGRAVSLHAIDQKRDRTPDNHHNEADESGPRRIWQEESLSDDE